MDRSVLNRRRALLLVPAATLALSGCGMFGKKKEPPPPPPPPPPTIVGLTLKAAADVNQSADSGARPIFVRVFSLASVTDFLASDFFALNGDPAAALGKALIVEADFTLSPGTTEVYQREFDDKTHFVGVMASYRDLDAASWRAFHEVPRNRTTLLIVDLGAKGITIRPADL